MMQDSNEMGALSPDLIQEILFQEREGYYAHDEEERTCRQIVQEELTEEEQEYAAETSYTYWWWVTHSSPPQGEERAAVRLRMAMREARRHWIGRDADYECAVSSLKETCHFRKEWNVNLLRTCFMNDNANNNNNSNNNSGMAKEDQDQREKYRLLVKDDMDKQLVVTRGVTQEMSAIIWKLSRTAGSHSAKGNGGADEQSMIDEEESYILTQIYALERGAAITEVISRGKEHHVTAVFDFGNYESKYSPSIGTVKNAVLLMQRHYPDRLLKLLIVDPSLWIKGIYNIIYPFLPDRTRNKLVLVTTSTESTASAAAAAASSALYSLGSSLSGFAFGTTTKNDNNKPAEEEVKKSSLPDNRGELILTQLGFPIANGEKAPTWLHVDTTGALQTDVNLDRYLHQLPFHCMYDLEAAAAIKVASS